MTGAATLLRDVFGFDGFRPGQQEIVEAVTEGENVLAIMPTGGGKSLCFQLPALMREGVTVVISPLIALMRDQVRSLQEAGVAAGALTSGNTPEETDAVWEALEAGTLKLLYMAPERLAAGSAMGMLRRVGVNLIAVDEAHCVSQWGHDFRPDYLRIGELRRTLDVPLAAFTATADAETQAEIVEKLFDGTPPRAFLRGFDRPNIHLAFAAKNKPRDQILAFAGARRGQSGIVYCGTRAKTEGLAKALRDQGQEALHYHGGMEAEDRRIAERRFQQEDGLIVCATVAFGMGVDKPDIRWVAHADLPKSIEAYYQETGRAGRDGDPAEAQLFWSAADFARARQWLGDVDESRLASERARLNALAGLLEASTCRRNILLRHFGEDPAQPCGNCDICLDPPKVIDVTQLAQKLLSAVYRTGQSFGIGHIEKVLQGREDDRVLQRGHERLSVFGILTEDEAPLLRSVMRAGLAHEMLVTTEHGGLALGPAARDVLKGERSVTIAEPPPKRRRTRNTAAPNPSGDPLFEALRARRAELARANGIPAYIIFHDSVLRAMAQEKPANLAAMAGLPGIGAKKLETYGEDFCAVVRSFAG